MAECERLCCPGSKNLVFSCVDVRRAVARHVSPSTITSRSSQSVSTAGRPSSRGPALTRGYVATLDRVSRVARRHTQDTRGERGSLLPKQVPFLRDPDRTTSERNADGHAQSKLCYHVIQHESET
jgi:hypothetical protein